MQILIVSPLREKLPSGNRVTAERWREILSNLENKVDVVGEYRGEHCDLLIALHAFKSFSSMVDFKRVFPELPLILALTGTDIYGEQKEGLEASLRLADRIVVLQQQAIEEVPSEFRSIVRVIYQSAGGLRNSVDKAQPFQVCALGHLRPVKDPLRTAYAVRDLPPHSKIHLVQAGRALDSECGKLARREAESNARFRWLGEIEHSEALRLLASSHLLSLTSKVEGGANVLSEALACGVPVVASQIPGLVGTLGDDYEGFFPAGDTGALRKLLLKAEVEPDYYDRLRIQCHKVADLVSPKKERQSWKSLLAELPDR